MAAGKKKTHEEYVLELAEKHPTLEVIGKYVNNATPIRHQCNVCGYNWEVRPGGLLSGHSCPVCRFPSKVIGQAPEYKNSIWASKYKKLAEFYGMTEEQMKTIMPMSNKKVEITCPNCANVKAIMPAELFTQNLACRYCSDGISYSEKFIASVLKQLNIHFKTHCSFDWSNRKQYDFYLPEHSCIIEAHGLQHYEDSRLAGPVEAQRANDLLKETFARTNGIQHYFQVDCRESDATWIRNSLKQSEIFDVLNVTESNVNWEQCAVDALHSKVKKVADLWALGYSVKEITEALNTDRLSVRRWLKKAAQAGLCTYNTQDSWERGHGVGWRMSHAKAMALRGKPVMCIETGVYYDSASAAGRQLDIPPSHINRSARHNGKYIAGGLHFNFIEINN